MSRRKKRKKQTAKEASKSKKPKIFNPLKGNIGRLKQKKVPDAPPEASKDPEQEAVEVFRQALSDVTPLSKGGKTNIRKPDPEIRPAHPAGKEEMEAVAHLSDLVTGHAQIDITFTDEYIEGAVAGFNRKLMKQLKKGMFPIQDYIDLHGLTRQEGEYRVHRFLVESHHKGLRCVLIVHGKGLNSADHLPVLKKRLPVWLNRGPVKKIVLAFSTARPYDGGTGALYVLLRSRGRP